MSEQNIQAANPSVVLNPFEGFDGQKIIRRIIGIWPIILIFIILGLFTGWLYLRYTLPSYLSSTSILIKEDKKSSSSIVDNAILKELTAGSMNKSVGNEIELLKSFDMMEHVVRNLEQYFTYKTIGRFADRISYQGFFPINVSAANIEKLSRPFTILIEKNGDKGWFWRVDSSGTKRNKIVLGKVESYNNIDLVFKSVPDSIGGNPTSPSPTAFSYKVDVNPLVATVNYFISKLKVEQVSENASVISMDLVDYNDERSIAILQELTREYNEKNFIDKNEVNSNTVKFLDERLRIFERDLKAIESRVSSFKSQNKVTSVTAEASQFLQQAGEVDMLKTNQKNQLNLIAALENELITNRNNPTLVPSTLGLSEPTLGSMIQEHNGLVLDRERLASISGPKNPGLLDLDRQIQNLRGSMIRNIASLKSAYTAQLNSIVARDKELSKSLVGVPEVERNLLEITRDRNVREQLYFFLLQKRAESAIALASSVVDSRIVEAPRTIGMVSPKSKPVWLIALFLGFFIPVIYVMLRDALDNTVGDKAEISTHTIAPLLGEISFIRKLKKRIIISDGDRSIVAEQFRSIRTQLEFTAKGKGLKRILVTSFRPGEGKSFTSLNLAASYTLLKKKVLILEFDLRKPRLARYLDLERKDGISSFLSGKSAIDDLIQEVPGYHGNFYIISAGPIPPNPAELINGEYMEPFMEELERRFDIIILDTPPFGVVADPLLLEKYADISIVVLRQGFTNKSVYSEINSRSAAKPDLLIYTILNGVGMQKKYEYAYGNYSYGYGYYSDDDQNKRFSLSKLARLFKV